jgi:DNA polymerase-1
MIKIDDRLKQENRSARLLRQIHDELVFEVPSDELKDLATLVSDAMSGVLPLAVPLKVDVKVGSNWSDLDPWQ